MMAIASARAILCFGCAGYELAVAIQADPFYLDVRAHYFPILVTISIVSLVVIVSLCIISVPLCIIISPTGTQKSLIFKRVSQLVAIKSTKGKESQEEPDVNN
jgi:hypothetical protein